MVLEQPVHVPRERVEFHLRDYKNYFLQNTRKLVLTFQNGRDIRHRTFGFTVKHVHLIFKDILTCDKQQQRPARVHLNIAHLGEEVQVEPVGLAPGPIAAVHVIADAQDHAE